MYIVAVSRGVQRAIAQGPEFMVAKRRPTPKMKDRNCKEQGPRRCFWPRSP